MDDRVLNTAFRWVFECLPGPIKVHIGLAIVTGLLCGAAAARLEAPPLSPPHAAIAGALLVYPILAAARYLVFGGPGPRRN